MEAEVAARGEGLMRFATEAVAKATLEQVAFRDAVKRASSAAEARYQTEQRREPQAHRYARGVQYSEAGTNVNMNLDLALQAREGELMRERMLNGVEMSDVSASGRQLVALFQCAPPRD